MRRGLFITFESVDGLGKTTQIKRLAEHLKAVGYDVFETKEPGDATKGSNIGLGVRQLVFRDPTTLNMHPGVADLLFLADHIQTSGDVAAAVARGRTVLCDRYADSQFAYAATSGKRCPPWALTLYSEHFGTVPDFTVLLIARGMVGEDGFEDISWALDRANRRNGVEAGKQDAKAWNSVEEQRKVQAAYLKHLTGQSRTVLVPVWEHQNMDEVQLAIWNGLRFAAKNFAPGTFEPDTQMADLLAIHEAPSDYASL